MKLRSPERENAQEVCPMKILVFLFLFALLSFLMLALDAAEKAES